jgi:hypothetical protein
VFASTTLSQLQSALGVSVEFVEPSFDEQDIAIKATLSNNNFFI